MCSSRSNDSILIQTVNSGAHAIVGVRGTFFSQEIVLYCTTAVILFSESVQLCSLMGFLYMRSSLPANGPYPLQKVIILKSASFGVRMDIIAK